MKGFFSQSPKKKKEAKSLPGRRKRRTFTRNQRQPRRITIMFIPHSDKKPVNFQVSPFTLGVITTALFVMMAGFIFFAMKYSDKKIDAVMTNQDLYEIEASLDMMRDEVKELLYTAGMFNETLSSTMSALEIDRDDEEFLAGASGDLSAFFDIEESDSQTLNEINDLKRLRTIMENSAENLNTVQSVFTEQTNLLTEVPCLWPVEGGVGHVTNNFGPAINPFNHTWYMHRGIDIADRSSPAIMATADGKVIETGFHRSYGNYIVIRHRYGFTTKYAHLQRTYAYEGQEVSQGDVIGIMGSTGNSTGPHVHYEVKIGTQLVDPSIYLDMGVNRRKTYDITTINLKGFDNYE